MQRLYNRCLNTHNFDTSSLEYKLNSIILDIANCRMFKPVNSDIPSESPRKFLNMKFANKGIDAINIGNILNHRDVVKNIPPYFKCQTTPKISILILILLHPKFLIISNRFVTSN